MTDSKSGKLVNINVFEYASIIIVHGLCQAISHHSPKIIDASLMVLCQRDNMASMAWSKSGKHSLGGQALR
jgi:hypothetical protein